MSDKTYRITIYIYGYDSDFHLDMLYPGCFGPDDVWRTYEYSFTGSVEERDEFISNELDEIEFSGGGRGALHYDIDIEGQS